MSDRAWGSRGRWFDAPIALVAIGWVAIWGLWPSSPPVVGRRPSRTEPARYTVGTTLPLHERPDLHVLPRIGVLEDRAGAATLSGVLPPPQPPARRVDLTPVSSPPSLSLEYRLPPVGREPGRRAMPTTPVFDRATLRGHAWHVWVSPALEAAGVTWPGAAWAGVPEPSGSFEAVLSVAPSAPSDPAGPHVFLERGSGSGPVDDALLQAARRLLAGQADPLPRGSIVISHIRASGE